MKGQKSLSEQYAVVARRVTSSGIDKVVGGKTEHIITLCELVIKNLKLGNKLQIEIGPYIDDVNMEDYKYIQDVKSDFLENIQSIGLINDLDFHAETQFDLETPQEVMFAFFTVVNDLNLKEYLVNEMSKISFDKKLEALIYENGVLTINNHKIKILSQSQSDADSLLKTLLKDLKKVWSFDEVLMDWGYSEEEINPSQKVYQAGLVVNKKVKEVTGINNFLNVTTKIVYINKDF